MTAPPTTLQLDTGRTFRGGQRQVNLLVRGLAERGHGVVLVVPPGAPLAAEARGVEGVEVCEVPMRGELSLRAVRALAGLLVSRGVQLVHAHTAHAITLAHLARLAGRRLPLVAHRHVAFAQRRHVLARRKRRWPDRWIAVSRAVADRLRADGVDAKRIAVVPAALEPEALEVRRSREAVRRELGVPADAILAGFVGALTANKDPALLLDAVAELAPQRDIPHLLIVGEGPLRAMLEQRARTFGLAGRVTFTGQVPRAADLLAACDLAVFPSRSEGSHNALKEAIALGVPVLASGIPAHRELGIPSDSLFEPGDAGGLAARLGTTLDDLPARRIAAADLAEIAGRFSPRVMVDAVAGIYRELVDPAPA